MSYEAVLIIKLNDEEEAELVENIIESGGYGINYWAQSAVIDDEAKTYTVTEQEDYSNDLRHIPEEAGVIPYVLTHKSLLDALVERAKVEPDAMLAITEKDGGYIDSDVADHVIQIAAFGELIYG